MKKLIAIAAIAFSTIANPLATRQFSGLSPKNPAPRAGNLLEWQADFSRPYQGMGDNITGGGLNGRWDRGNLGISLGFSYLNSDMYAQGLLGVGMGYRLGNFSLGITPSFAFDSWNTANFHYTDDETEIDPYFADNENQTGFTVAAGTRYDAGRLGEFGIIAENILPVALSDEATDRNALEPKVNLTWGYPLWEGGLSIGATYDIAGPDQGKIDGSVGYMRNVYGPLSAGAAVDMDALDALVSINIARSIALSYAFEYPLSEVGKVAQSHRISISGAAIPVKERPNLAVLIDIQKDNSEKGDTLILEITAICENLPVQNAELILRTGDEILMKETLALEPGDRKTFDTEYVRVEDRLFTAEIDPMNTVKETSERDNSATAFTEVKTVPVIPLICSMSMTPEELKLKNIKYTYQDHSMVPRVFFAVNSDEIDDRFDFLLDVISERLARNPDVRLTLAGYVTEGETRGTLPDRRAIAVFNELLEREPLLRERIEIEADPDTTAQSVPTEGVTPEDTPLLLEENRRAELSVSIPDSHYIEAPYGTELDVDIVPMEELMRRNPDIVMVVSTDSRTGDMERAMDEAARLKQQMIEMLGIEYSHRVFASVARMEEKADISHIFLSPEAVLYKPHVFAGSREMVPERISNAEITIECQGDVDRWHIDALDTETGELVSTIKEGTGSVPEYMEWDFRSPQGELLPIGRTLNLRLIAENDRGQVDTVTAEEDIRTTVEESEIRDEKMLLVQFEFDRPIARSRYLEDRLEQVSDRIIEIIEGSTESEIIVEGHTDIIGKEPRNDRLSIERAEAVEELLRLTMANSLGLSLEGLKGWLKERKATIESEGFGSKKPLEVEVFRNGEKSTVLAGDNKLPEGRTINRSVIVIVRGEKR